MNALDYVSNRKGKCVVSAGKFVLCCVTSVPIQCLILTRHDTILTELEVISSPVLVSCSDVSMKHILQWVVREGISPFYPGIAITVPVELHRTTSFRLTHTSWQRKGRLSWFLGSWHNNLYFVTYFLVVLLSLNNVGLYSLLLIKKTMRLSEYHAVVF
jgi:hypothetical protein